jgi:hypothetical protein
MSPPTRRSRGLGFPQRVDGFKTLGGSTFEVGGREAAAVVKRNSRTIVVTGTPTSTRQTLALEPPA